MTEIIRNEMKLEVFGVKATAHGVVENGGLIRSQRIKASRKLPDGGRIVVTLRFDDECGNGHETFSITGDTWDEGGREESGGCIHEEIAKRFPELAHLIKWHLVSTDGPVHYITNTVYLAGDRDHNGLRKGEERQLRNSRTGELSWKMEGIRTQYADGPICPNGEVVLKWEPWMRVGEGKERQLDFARSSAVWPEASDLELMQEPEALKAALASRLPALMQAFLADMAEIGFVMPGSFTKLD